MTPADELVHVVDDDEGVRDSLSILFEAVGFETRTYASAEAFLDALPTATAGCVITDVRMAEISGLDLLRRLQALGNDLPVIVLTGEADIPMAVEALKGGAVDFIQKPFDAAKILGAARAALQQARATAERGGARDKVGERIAGLSRRERQVLDGVVAGQSNKTIAIDLGISPRTVEIYRANIMTKMQAGSLSELVRLVVSAGARGSQTGSAAT